MYENNKDFRSNYLIMVFWHLLINSYLVQGFNVLQVSSPVSQSVPEVSQT
jgi:hypothetical protein